MEYLYINKYQIVIEGNKEFLNIIKIVFVYRKVYLEILFKKLEFNNLVKFCIFDLLR